MKRKKKKLVWMAACIALAAALGGCMETPEDSCIVKEKETETGKIFSGTESEENVSIAEQVQAAQKKQQICTVQNQSRYLRKIVKSRRGKNGSRRYGKEISPSA